ncbi:unnamed protein product, partial [Mesorhabditis belari]|uniref:HTH CENPB-type domain-containing protein n=1 Tax=Mesorhabditis belari TaxID=2138241 RepID=A0AAF3EQ23_9BILA
MELQAPPRTKRRLDLAIKKQIIDAAMTKKISQVAMEFDLPQSTVSTILKNRVRISEIIDCGVNTKRSRVSYCKHPELEDALRKWVKERQMVDAPLNGPMLREQALKMAETLRIDDFQASNGWLMNFKSRHSLAFVGDEKKSGDSANEYLDHRLPTMITKPSISRQEAYESFTKFREYIQENSADPKIFQACFDIEDFFINELVKEIPLKSVSDSV